MDWGVVLQVVSACLVVLGLFIGGFWRMWGLIKDVRSEANIRGEAAVALASTIRTELHAHQLHVSATYVSKEGLREQTGQIMSAIEQVGTQIANMNGRIDRMLERPTTTRSTTRA